MSMYIIFFGTIFLHSVSLGAIGVVKMGDFIGEELITERGMKERLESAYSESEAFLLEIPVSEWKRLKDMLIMMGLKKD